MSTPRRCAKCGATLGASFPCGYCGSAYRTGDRPALTPSETAGPTPEHYGPLVDEPYPRDQVATWLRLEANRTPRGRGKATLLWLAEQFAAPSPVSPSPAVGPTPQSTDVGGSTEKAATPAPSAPATPNQPLEPRLP